LRRKVQADDFEEAQNYYLNEVMPYFEKLKNKTRDLLMLNQEEMRSAQQQANNNSEQAIYSTLLFSFIAVVLALIFGIYTSNFIIKPIKTFTEKVKKVGRGNLNQIIEIKGKDEIAELAKEFNSMTQRLKEYEELNINKLISEKNKTEAIIKSISSPILVTDNNKNILLVNPAAEDFFELRESEIRQKHFLEVIKNEQIFKLLDKFLSEDEFELNEDEIISLTKEDETYHFKIKITPVKDKTKKSQLAVILLEDITHLKEIDQMKSEFISMVSHEFRTPLTSMNMGVDLLLEEDVGKVNEEQSELLKVIKEDCQRLNNLVNDLLDLSKIESGEIDIDFANTDIKSLFKISLKPFLEQAKKQEVKLLTGVIGNIEAYCDVNKISWVITNLVGNALRYTEKDDQIKLDAKKRGSKIYISVADTGAGIPEKHQEKIFDKFVRVSDDKDDNTGTGLGLAIAKEIIEAHGGRIWVDSKVDEGSTFTFSLQAAKTKAVTKSEGLKDE